MSDTRLRSTVLTKGREEFLPEGGVLTYFEGHKYPVHGYTSDESMWAAEVLKKHIISWVRFAGQNKILTFISLLGFRKRLDGWLLEFGRFCDGVVSKYSNPKYFSPAVKHFYNVAINLWGDLPIREYCINSGKENVPVVYRVLKRDGSPYTEEDRYKWSLKDFVILGICVVLENDKYYRWVWQDLMMCVRKWELVKNPAKEVSRLVNLWLEREHRPAYKSIGWTVKMILWILPSIRLEISNFAEGCDFSKFNMDRYDFWGALNSQVVGNYSYSFGGMTKEEMKELYPRI